MMTDCTHTVCPPGYVEWHEWAAKKHRTHVSTKCPGCGLYKLWVPRAKPLSDAQMKRSLGYVP